MDAGTSTGILVPSNEMSGDAANDALEPCLEALIRRRCFLDGGMGAVGFAAVSVNRS